MKNDSRRAAAVVGLDVGDQTSELCVRGSQGEVVERAQLQTREVGLCRWFGQRRGLRVVLEAGTHSPWISRLLTRLGHEAVVLQPRRVQLIAQSREKTDRVDAELLAFLGCFPDAELHRVQHRSEAAQVDLELLRARMTVVRARTALINHARGAVKALGMRLPKCDADYFHAKAAQALPPQFQQAVDPILALIAQHTAAIQGYNQEIDRLCRVNATLGN